MTTMKIGMRTSSGVNLRSAEMSTLLITSTKMTAMPMKNEPSNFVETASVEHRPIMSTVSGFSSESPSMKTLDPLASLRHLPALDSTSA